MTEEKTEELAVWEPKKFDGSDLLPVSLAKEQEAASVEGVPIVGMDNVDAKDLVLPTLYLLQGQSKAVTDGPDEAKPGRFYLSSTDEVFYPPIRMIFVHHSTGNVLFPKNPKEYPRYEGIEKCIARDSVTGTKYGKCEECRKCLDWGPNNEPPLGAQTHSFAVMTPTGPAMLRFSRSSYKAANKFLTAVVTNPVRKNLWAHPVVCRVNSDTKNDPGGMTSTYFHMELIWQQSEAVPPAIQRAAYDLHQKVKLAHEAGRLQTEEGGDDDFPAE